MRDRAVLLEIVNSVAWLRLNRPKSRNAVNGALLDELDKAIDVAETDSSVRVVVITGTGKAFCAGGDMTQYAQDDGSVDVVKLMARISRATNVIDRLSDLDKPVIAAVNGHAVAGGMTIMLACDLVIAADNAEIGDGHSNYGMVSGTAGTVELAKVTGKNFAKYMAFSGDTVNASELVKFGLVNEVVPADKLHSRVNAIAERLAKKSPRVLASMKRLINDGIEQPKTVVSQMARQALALHVYCSNDMEKGLTAFREKRSTEIASQ